MSFPLVPKSVASNNLERRGRYCCFISPNSVASGAHCVKVVEDVVKSSRSLFAISSPDELIVQLLLTVEDVNKQRIVYPVSTFT